MEGVSDGDESFDRQLTEKLLREGDRVGVTGEEFPDRRRVIDTKDSTPSVR